MRASWRSSPRATAALTCTACHWLRGATNRTEDGPSPQTGVRTRDEERLGPNNGGPCIPARCWSADSARSFWMLSKEGLIMSRFKRKGFTLIELLVVIAIIAVLI